MDPAPRRAALTVLIIGGIVGAVALVAAQALREPLQQWLVANPAQTASRATLLIAVAGALLVIPLLVFAGYALRSAAKMEARRARGLRIIAAMLAAGATALVAILWRFSVVLTR